MGWIDTVHSYSGLKNVFFHSVLFVNYYNNVVIEMIVVGDSRYGKNIDIIMSINYPSQHLFENKKYKYKECGVQEQQQCPICNNYYNNSNK